MRQVSPALVALVLTDAADAESLVDGHFRHNGTLEGDQFPLAEAQNLAEELMDDCNRQKAPGDPVSTFAFQVRESPGLSWSCRA